MAAAADIYRIELHDTAGKPSLVRTALLSLIRVFRKRPNAEGPAGMIISVVNKETGDELFRHIEDIGDDEGHLLDGIERDLASMTADEFAARWGS